MNDSDLIRALRRIKVETGSLVCLGCGHEHNCSIYGCAIINEAVKRLEVLMYLERRVEGSNGPNNR